jgi:methionine sulfoxide reductase heme-binding subunit
MFPWNDRAGRLSPLKLAVFCYCLAPAGWLAYAGYANLLGTKPLTVALHDVGDLAVRFLLLSLLVTPLRLIARWPGLIAVRRMLGLAALAYVLLHVMLYVAQQGFDLWKVGSEIVLRFYLTIGLVALLGLLALGVTSTDGMIKRLGAVRWNRLHSLVYGIAVLALVHFALQSKLDVSQAMLMTGFFFWLMGFRLMRRQGLRVSAMSLAALAAAAGALTALAETGWYAVMTGVPPLRVLAANLDVELAIRPAVWVLLTGLGLVGVWLVRRHGVPEAGRAGDMSRRKNASATSSPASAIETTPA